MTKQFEDLVTELLREVRDNQQKFLDRFEVVDERAERVEASLNEHRSQSENRHTEILRAFPGGDTDGHRRYHEAMIERIEIRNKLVRECLMHAAKASFLAGLGWLIYAIWVAIKMELTK